MRAGAREYLVAGEPDLLDKTVQGFLETSGALRLGEVTAIVPAKGGMGGTTIAINLAGALHRQGKRVCIVDLGVELGDVLSFLDVKGTYSITDVAGNTKRLDRELLDSSVPRHTSGVWVLSQSEKLTEAEQLDATAVTAVLRFMRTQYDHLILDGLRNFGDVPLAALDVADRIILVVTQEVPAVRNAQRRAEIFRRLGYEQNRTMLVVNRYQKGSSITRQVIEQTVGLPVSAVVGNDFRALTAAVNRGVLLWDESPKSVVTKDIDDLASLIAPAAAEPRPARFLGKLFSPKAVLHGAQ
jgi:pilus assembly protein CpaE